MEMLHVVGDSKGFQFLDRILWPLLSLLCLPALNASLIFSYHLISCAVCHLFFHWPLFLSLPWLLLVYFYQQITSKWFSHLPCKAFTALELIIDLILTHVTQHQHQALKEKHHAEITNFVLRICKVCNEKKILKKNPLKRRK